MTEPNRLPADNSDKRAEDWTRAAEVMSAATFRADISAIAAFCRRLNQRAEARAEKRAKRLAYREAEAERILRGIRR